MLSRIIKGTEKSESQERDSADAGEDCPFSGVNPDAFGTETDRTRTRVPFRYKADGGASNWHAQELHAIYSNNVPLTQVEEESRGSFSNAGVVFLLFVVLAGVGTYFIAGKQTQSSAAEGNAVVQAGLPPSEPNLKEEPVPAARVEAAPAFVESRGSDDLLKDDASSLSLRLDPPESIGEFIARSTVNGVFMRGSSSKVTLNGTTFSVNETVSEDLGLVFIGFHRDRKRAVFQGPDDLYYLMNIGR